MNPVIEAILQRRSVRAFSGKRIPDADLELIAKCAAYAPSALNRQKWHFTVLHSEKQINALAKVMRETLGLGDSYCFYGPDALIIASAPRDYSFAVQDCSCALENIFLAAHSLGIGSVWINQLSDAGACDNREIRKVLDSFGFPKDDVAVGMASLGYPAPDLPPRAAKNESVIIRQEGD